MLESSLLLLNQVLMIFMLIAVGYIINKCGMLTKDGAKQLTDVLLIIVTPAVIINAFMIPFDVVKLTGMGIAFIVSAAVHILGILIGKLFYTKEPKDRQSVYRFAIIYANTSFMAIPLIQAMLGPDAVIYGAMAVIAFQLFIWTHGVVLMSGENKISAKKLIINPGIMGSAIAAIIFFFSINLPAPLRGAIKMLGDLNTPLAMIIIGSFMANVKLKSALTKKEIYIATFIRLIAIPAAILLILHWLNLPELLHNACVISASAPIAANTSLFAARYEQDTELAGELVAFSTLCSIITMPLMLILAA